MEELLICSAALSGVLGLASLLAGVFWHYLARAGWVFPPQAEDFNRLQVLKRLWPQVLEQEVVGQTPRGSRSNQNGPRRGRIL